MAEDWDVSRTHPVRVKVPDPDSLMQIFDNISYAKGSVICRMLAHYIEDAELFKACLTKYMHTFRYKCAKTEDLLAIMDEVTSERLDKFDDQSEKISVSQFIMPWITQPSFPVVRIERL